MRFITIGRHDFTPIQKQLLKKAGMSEEVARVENVENIADVIKLAKEKGANAIVVQALPMHLLAQLLQLAARAGISVFGFRIEAVGLAKSREEAEKLAREKGADVLVPARDGSWRVSRTVALQRLKRIVVEAEDVVHV